MRRPIGARLVRLLARLLAWTYPEAFRRQYAQAFPEVAEDRWWRERERGRGRLAATLATVGVLTRDTGTGHAISRRLGPVARRVSRSALLLDRYSLHSRLAIRSVRRAPFILAVATVSLAVGIGANTAVFSAANGLLLAPAAGVEDPGRLLTVCRATPDSGCDTLSYPTFLEYRARMKAFTDVYAERFGTTALSLVSSGGVDVVYGQEVSANYFSVLGVRLAAGRSFTQSDQRPGRQDRQVVLSEALWRTRFGGEGGIVGRDVILNGDHYAIAGVAPRGFEGTTIVRPDLWVPLTSDGHGLSSAALLRSRGSLWLVMGARLSPGATIAQARAESAVFAADEQRAYPELTHRLGLAVLPSRRMPEGTEEVAQLFAVLLGLVAVVLLVTCANLSGLLLARASGRTREMALRRALGASRKGLVGLCLVETAVLFLPGFTLALLAAPIALQSVARLAALLPVPIDARLPLDWRVLSFTAAVTFGMVLVTAVAPAWQTTKSDLITGLKRERSAPRPQRLRRLFVGAQLAFCLVSIAMAGLLWRELRQATAIDPGFQVVGTDVASIDLTLAGYPDSQAASATEMIRRRLAALPGVQSVGVASVVPLKGESMGLGDLRRPGETNPEAIIHASWNVISPEFLPTMRIPVVGGRNFTSADQAPSLRHAIVNEYFARAAWPGQDAIGQRLETGDFRPGHEDSLSEVTVVGIARDAKYKWVDETPTAFIYVPLSESPSLNPNFFIRRQPGVSSAGLAPEVRHAVTSFDRTLPVLAFSTLSDQADLGLFPERLAADVAGLLGMVALLLAAIGLYGLTAFLVSSRTREIGLRVALGADPRRIVRFALMQGLETAAFGSAIGLVLALFAARLLAGALREVSPLDPVAFGATVGTILVVSTVASYVPARRVARVDPAVSLRTE